MNVVSPIWRHARLRPSSPAIIMPQGILSYAEFGAAIGRAAKHFVDQGLRAGDRVGISLDNGILHLVAMLGLAHAGVAHVAMPLSNPPLLRARTAERLRLAAVLCDDGGGECPGASPLRVDRDWLRRGTPPVDLPKESAGDGLGWLILQSSGTTGEPKFAELSHAAAMQRSRRFGPLFGCRETDRFWAASRIDFVVAKQRALFCLHSGAALCFSAGLRDRAELLAYFRRAGVTLMCAAPSHMFGLIKMSARAPAVPSLRVFEARSATVGEPLRREFRARFSPNLFIVYGTNEGESLAMATPEIQARVPDTVGIPVAGVELQVVDDADRTMPPGAVGYVRVRGPGVVTSYLDDPAATAKSFRDGWFYPGDLASFTSEGALVLHGRTDDMMIFDGMNIYPAEIERALLEHPAVAEAAAFPLHSDRHQDVPAAAVTLRSPVTRKVLDLHCTERLGPKRPHAILLLRDFPRNAMGKILKRELSAALASGNMAELAALANSSPD